MSRELRYPAISFNQMFGLIFGGVYLAVGAGGFVSTGGIDFAAVNGGHELHAFEVNPLHNVAHLAIGATLLLAALAGPRLSRSANGVVGAAYLALGLVGWLLLSTDANILALNGADNVLHLGTGVVALSVAIVLGSRDSVGAKESVGAGV